MNERASGRLYGGISEPPGSDLASEPDFVMIGANSAYEIISGKSCKDLAGRSVFEAFPDNPAEPAATGTHNLGASLRRAAESGERDVMALQRYDVEVPGQPGVFRERYWCPVNVRGQGRRWPGHHADSPRGGGLRPDPQIRRRSGRQRLSSPVSGRCPLLPAEMDEDAAEVLGVLLHPVIQRLDVLAVEESQDVLLELPEPLPGMISTRGAFVLTASSMMSCSALSMSRPRL